MILRYLSKGTLEAAVGNELLSRLEGLLPAIDPENYDPTHIYRRETLLRILASFSPANRMRSREFVGSMLNSAPPELLDEICEATGVGTHDDGFEARRDALVRRGWANKAFCEAFIEAAGLPQEFLPQRSAPRLPVEEIAVSAAPYKRLKDFQFDVYLQAAAQLAVTRSRFMVQMPTGSGKTRTSMEFVCEALARAPEGSLVCWLAHSEELCEQAVACFREVWFHVGTEAVSVFRGWGAAGVLPSPESAGGFFVAGFDKLRSLLGSQPEAFAGLRDRLTLVVVDEAHRVLAPTYQEVTRELVGDDTHLVGLTATPGRSATLEEDNRDLAEFFFNTIIGIDAPEGVSVFEFLRNRSILARVVMEPLYSGGNYEMTGSQLAHLERTFDYAPGFLSALGRDDLRNLEIIRKLLSECELQRRVLLFACSVEHSQFLCALLSFFGVKAAHVDGTTAPVERAANIAGFRAGELQVLSNYGVLSTGFDAPQTDVVFITRPTQSLVLYSQMIGRGLRGPAIGGTEVCKVVNVIDNIAGMPAENAIHEYFDEYWVEE